MLTQRVVTALLLLPLLLAAIWWLPSAVLYAVLSLAALIAAWEWAALAGYADLRGRLVYVLVAAAALTASWWLRDHWLVLLALATGWWLVAVRWLWGYPANFQRRKPTSTELAVVGLLIVVPAIAAMSMLHQGSDGPLRLLFVFFLIFAADTGAYFAGRRFGRHKLAVAISPGKTVEGALGGAALAAVWALVAGLWLFDLHGAALALLLGLSMLVVAASIVGDLTESLFKRSAGVKDSGQLLPGHGGLLDRIDGVLAAAPVMAIGLTVFGL